MTTFQDPQPQSRRAVRQSERGDTSEPVEAAPAFYPTAPPPADTWDTVARRAAQLPPTPPRAEAPAASGRRSAHPAPVPPTSEPLNYSTEGRAPVQREPEPQAQPPVQPVQQMFRPRGSSTTPQAAPAAQQAASPVAQPDAQPSSPRPADEQQSFRVRDFSPEGRRASAPQSWLDASATPAAAPATAPTPASAPSDLDYHTEARLHYEVPVVPAQTAPDPTIDRHTEPGLPIEQTLTRRELRAQIALDQQASGAVPEFDAPSQAAAAHNLAAFPPAPEPKADTALTNAIAEFDALTQRSEASQQLHAEREAQVAAERATAERAAAERAAADRVEADRAAADRAAAEREAAAEEARAAAAAAAEQVAAQAALEAQQQQAARAAEQDAAARTEWEQRQAAEQARAAAAQAAAAQAAAAQAAVAQAAAAEASDQAAAQVAPPLVAPEQAPSQTEPSAWTPPLGHWSVQAGLDDAEPYENTINRTVGSGSPTTSALVIPTVPGSNDIRGPLTGTGEIMLTGSIDLPHSFSSTGASARFDPEGIDAFFDAGDAEVISTDSAPVRAIRAVSTHNSGQGVTHTQKPKGTRTLTVLLIAASSMAVIVAGLLVTAFALNIF